MTAGTIPLSLDGYTDLPPGKIANVVTYFEILAPPANRATDRRDLSLRRVVAPELAWYRDLYRRIGEDWLWFSRAVMPDEKLAAELARPGSEIFALDRAGATVGMAELHRQSPREVEIEMFGVVPQATGTGAAGWLMAETLAHAFQPGVERVWLHTCTFDHPAAVPFYLRSGFRACKYAIEVSDDPRLTGHLPRTAAPHVPMIDEAPGW